MALPVPETRFLFFTGKGGVGKTTVASATALRLSDSGRRVLLVSTDPASNLGDVFETAVGADAVPVTGAPGLSLRNIDPEAAAAAYRDRVVAPYRGRLPEAAVRNMEEQLSGACTVEIAAFNEFTTLLADPSATTSFDHVVFDTAPTGHTLRLLALPAAWTGFLDANTSGTSCLGPLAGLEERREQYAAAMRMLADPAQTTVMLVARAEASALAEAARAGDELAALGIARQELVINGVLEGGSGSDPVAAAMVARQERALATLPAALRALPSARLPLLAGDLRGLEGLRSVGRSDANPATPKVASPDASLLATLPGLDDLVESLRRDGSGIVMTMGKGGVGKTTLAAALARELAATGATVHLSTTDPAAHVAAAVGTDCPPTLHVSRIDPATETAAYTAEVLAAAGDLDEEERALLTEDLRSPCTEEIAVFRAFARTVASAASAFVVLDTAPTGHTLLLIDAAESYHREVARTAGDHIPEAVRRLLPRLRDPRFAKVLIVTLAEYTPIAEAARLQADLERAGITPFGWVVNASLAVSGTTHPVLAARAAMEVPRVRQLTEGLASRTWLLPWSPEPATAAHPSVMAAKAALEEGGLPGAFGDALVSGLA